MVVPVSIDGKSILTLYYSTLRKVHKNLTCWTCPGMRTNQECNDWAPDIHCPQNHTTCATIHRFNITTTYSIMVTKKCVLPTGCDKTAVGCTIVDTGTMECMACCMTSYCNRDIPSDMNSAIHQTSNAISVTFVKSKILFFTNCCFVLYRNECHQIVLLHLLYNIIIVTAMMN